MFATGIQEKNSKEIKYLYKKKFGARLNFVGDIWKSKVKNSNGYSYSF